MIDKRFNSKCVEIDNGCIEYRGAKINTGYRKLCRGGKCLLAHRYAWIMANGAIPDGMCVLHKCDNRSCVNPDHLFIGDRTANMQDMINKGRNNFSGLRTGKWIENLPKRYGEENHSCKIDFDTVKYIKHLYFAERRTTVELAKWAGVSQAHIWRIVAGESRVHG